MKKYSVYIDKQTNALLCWILETKLLITQSLREKNIFTILVSAIVLACIAGDLLVKIYLQFESNVKILILWMFWLRFTDAIQFSCCRFWNSTKDVVSVLVVLCDSVAQVLEIRIRVGLAITYKHHSLEAIFSLWSYKLFVTTDNSVIFEQISHHAEHA